MNTRYAAEDALVEQVRSRWSALLKMAEEQAPTAVSFVMSGHNNFEDRGHAAKIARFFAQATGVACQEHVVPTEERGIVSVSAGNCYPEAQECLTALDEGLRGIDRAEALADAESGL